MWLSKTTGTFIEQAINIHGDKYDYSLVCYINAHKKIDVVCPIHGTFKQEPNEHLKGCGCPICGRYSKKHPNAKLTQMEFIEKANVIHQNKYTYDKVVYKTSKTNVKITCRIHGDFKQTPNAHLSRRGCPKCFKYSESKGERDIARYLTDHKIDFIRQKIFESPPPFNKLRYDFFIPKLDMVIEFNGQQHYKPISFFGKESGFLKQKNADDRKRIFCNTNGIKLIIISYKKLNKIKDVLDSIMMPTAR